MNPLVFISHASEDKDDFVRPLAQQLEDAGVRVWYDEFTLHPGARLRAQLDRGLAECTHGVVVLSPSFFAKGWPEWELDGLVQRQIRGDDVIIPIWHRVTAEDVARYSLPLANIFAIASALGVPRVVELIVRAIHEPPTTAADSRSIVIPPTAADEARHQQAVALYEAGDERGALLIWASLTRAKDPEVRAVAMLNLGTAKEKLGDLVGARQCYERAMEAQAFPEVAGTAAYNLGKMTETTEPAVAEAAYRHAFEAGRLELAAAASIKLGLSSMERGDVGAAERFWRVGTRAADAEVRGTAGNNLGLLLRDTRRFDEAVGVFEEVVHTGSPRQSAGASLNLGGLLMMRRPPDRAGAAWHWRRVSDSPFRALAAQARENLRRLEEEDE